MEDHPLLARGRTAEIRQWQDGRIVKWFAPWVDAGEAAHEIRATRLAMDAGLPVPHVYEDRILDGRAAIVFEKVTGETMLRRIQIAPWNAFALAIEMGRLHRRLHAVSAGELPSMKAGLAASFPRAVQRGLPDWAVPLLLQRLNALPDGDHLLHGDYHPDNLILSPRGMVVLDWMTARSGPPAADVARTVLLLTIGGLPGDGPAPAWVWLARRILLWGYLRGLGSQKPDYRAWMGVIAAARLVENIPGERAALLHLIDTSIESR